MRRATARTPLYRLLALPALLALVACRNAPPPLETTVGGATPTPSAAASGPRPFAGGGAPQAIAFDPPLGASGVDPARTSLSVTFDRPMDPEGWAWVVESPETAPEMGESHWDAAVRVNTAHVKLQPNRSYVVWVNSKAFAYFRGPDGTPAPPVRWEFSTAATSAAGSPGTAGAPAPPPIAPVRSHQPTGGDSPRVVALHPPGGARDIDPAAVSELRVTFDRKMDEGWSWVMESGESFPPIAGKAYQTPDGLSAALPVKLEPGRSYVVWLNSEQYDGFHDTAGRPLSPVRWEFSTAGTPRPDWAPPPPGR